MSNWISVKEASLKDGEIITAHAPAWDVLPVTAIYLDNKIYDLDGKNEMGDYNWDITEVVTHVVILEPLPEPPKQ